jgi:hypothetical protein
MRLGGVEVAVGALDRSRDGQARRGDRRRSSQLCVDLTRSLDEREGLSRIAAHSQQPAEVHENVRLADPVVHLGVEQ